MPKTTTIVVKSDFLATHYYPDAPDKVAFLRHPHRHRFDVVVEIEVKHNDRDLEFFMVEYELREIIMDLLNYEPGMVCSSMGSTSCEEAASYILDQMQDIYDGHKVVAVSVFEDGENGAIVRQV